MVLSGIALIVVFLLLSAFFSGVETAFLSSSRLKIELKMLQGSKAARILSDFKRQESKVLISILIASNIILVMCTGELDEISTPFLESFLEKGHWLVTVFQTIITTVIVLIFAEYIPKAVFRRLSDRIIFPSAYLLRFFYVLLMPLTWIVNKISKAILVLLKAPSEDDVVQLGKKDLEHYIEEVSASASPQAPVAVDLDTEMLQNALEFKETRAREFMIPRTQLVAVSEDESLAAIMQLFIETKHSRVLIYADNLDHVKGFVHSNDFFGRPTEIAPILKPVLLVPESMSADVLLREFGETRRTVAIVVDEFGGTSGMITMEDLIEEVFGDIEDEHDDAPTATPEEEDLQLIANHDGSYILGGRLDIYDLNQRLALDLPQEDAYTSVGGLIVYYAERIPKEGETIEMGEFDIAILKATETRVLLLRLNKRHEVA